MKSLLLRLVLLVAILSAAGCASLADGLTQFAYQLEQQRLQQEQQAWEYAMYAPRPSSDTSAPGIK